MRPITILYFGTTDFSAQVLGALAENEQFSVVGVVTQPPRPVGREQTLAPSAVGSAAANRNIPIFAPESLKKFDTSTLPKADVFVVYAYGALIPQALLDLSPHGSLNIHPSLLPLYRGPTPVQSAIMNGDRETGVSIILLDKEMDHGPILVQLKELIASKDTTATLTGKLVQKIMPALIEAIPAWVNGAMTAIPQDENNVTICRMLTRDDGKIDFNLSAQTIYNRFRALTPWPGIWTTWNGQRLKLLDCRPNNAMLATGQVLLQKDSLLIGTPEGSLAVYELQLEGKKPMIAAIFANGYKKILEGFAS